MKYFVCAQFDQNSPKPVCTAWVELDQSLLQNLPQQSLFSELANLTYSDISILLVFTASIFATAWIWGFLSKQASK